MPALFQKLIHACYLYLEKGVADQLQTNYASDLRNILKTVFIMCATEPFVITPEEPSKSGSSPEEPSNDEGPSTSATSPNGATGSSGGTGSPAGRASPTNGRVHFDSETNSEGAVAGDSVPLNHTNEHSEIEKLSVKYFKNSLSV